MSASKIVFCFDLASSQAFLAAKKLTSATPRASVSYLPILRGLLHKLNFEGEPPKDVVSPSKEKHLQYDFLREAGRLGVKLDSAHPRATLEQQDFSLAQRLIASVSDESKRSSLSLKLFERVWIDRADVSSVDSLHKVSKPLGIDAQAAVDASSEKTLDANTRWTLEKGAFDVPSFLATRPDGREELFFGADRMHLMNAFLGGLKSSPNPPKIDARWPRKKVLFFYDYSSPWTYLSYKKIPQVLGPLAHVDVEYVPVLLGALFKALGKNYVPTSVASKRKNKYFLKDLQDCATYDGFSVRFTDFFPLRTVQALRATLLEPSLIGPFFDAAWRDNVNLGEESAVLQIIQRHLPNADAQQLLERCKSDEVKNKLAENTERALKLSVFGCPTFAVDGSNRASDGYPELFFGQDRMEAMAEYLIPK